MASQPAPQPGRRHTASTTEPYCRSSSLVGCLATQLAYQTSAKVGKTRACVSTLRGTRSIGVVATEASSAAIAAPRAQGARPMLRLARPRLPSCAR
eukprot:CAMPEP_0203928524 /NCGR_PEP_ID=MMETSP0359-20131031/67769_1 /ASSEMBLY_ACC=CAM_ASM_000338 /TAXON_ID=268821 /ORGANISM="Scrippsiella Hangoei, Strain SHTV-5" /LENGTH=95 /DNA_ID=CAMNT_0050857465 /DNA_START=163 /DNA_END=447 /DNA_ORIENTATION=-